jgi:hypothetical protein
MIITYHMSYQTPQLISPVRRVGVLPFASWRMFYVNINNYLCIITFAIHYIHSWFVHFTLSRRLLFLVSLETLPGHSSFVTLSSNFNLRFTLLDSKLRLINGIYQGCQFSLTFSVI